MNRIGLRSRLLISHLLVMGIPLLSFILISKAFSANVFAYRLAQLEERGLRFAQLVTYYLKAMTLPGATAPDGRFWSGASLRHC